MTAASPPPPEFTALAQAVLRRCFPGADADGVAEIGAGGSARRFFRLGAYPASVVGMLSPSPPVGENGVDENHCFDYVARLLAEAGAPVPGILHRNLEKGWFVLEDAGERLLHDLLRAQGEAAAEPFYRKTLDCLVRIQSQATRDFAPDRTHNPPYNGTFARRWESGYFMERLLLPLRSPADPAAAGPNARLRPGPPFPAAEALAPELDRLAEELDRSPLPTVFIHRDFQSQNITIRGGGVGILDFQGARLGPPAYDAASLLLDPYARLAPRRVDDLLFYYIDAAILEGVFENADAFRATFPLVAAHRLMQALGAYGFLSWVKGKVWFLSHVKPALTILGRLLEEPCPAFRHVPALRETVAALAARWRPGETDPDPGTGRPAGNRPFRG